MTTSFEPTLEQITALHTYATEYQKYGGASWKEQLMDDWRTGKDVSAIPEGHLLRQLRNKGGPSWLSGYDLPHIPEHPDDAALQVLRDVTEGLMKLPVHCRPGLAEYIMDGRPVGGFLTAVLRNDLMDAACRADGENATRLKDYALFLSNCAPNFCHGSRTRVDEWIEHGGYRGRGR
jgi:hypothetical protein